MLYKGASTLVFTLEFLNSFLFFLILIYIFILKPNRLVVIVYTTVRNFLDKNNCNDTIRDAFENWRKVIEGNDFANLSQLKKVFNSVDYVGNDRYVFNVLGNNYRLVVMIHFSVRTVYILFVGTHLEYNKIDAKTITFKK